MPTILIITLLILTLFLLCKWEYVVMFIMFLPIRLLQRKKKKVKKDIANSPKGEGVGEKSIPARSSMLQTVKNKIYIYLDGYIRYLGIRIGMIPSMRIRLFLYRHMLLADIASSAIVYYGAELRAAEKLNIGGGTICGDCARLDARYGIEIGRNVNMSTGVWIWTAQHDYNSPTFSCSGKCGKVTIGDRAWLGPRVIILPGVSIGEGAVVGAGAVVTKDVAPYTLVGGVPAKKIGERNKELTYEFNGGHIPFY